MENLPKKTRVTRYNCILVKETCHLYTVPRQIKAPVDVYDYMEEVMQLSNQSVEYFVAIFLDVKCKPIGYQVISQGNLTASLVHPREVFKGALLANAYSIMVVHNHPSGDPRFSNEDRVITKRLQEAGEILGISLLDHIVIGDKAYLSFKEEEGL